MEFLFRLLYQNGFQGSCVNGLNDETSQEVEQYFGSMCSGGWLLLSAATACCTMLALPPESQSSDYVVVPEKEKNKAFKIVSW